MYIVLLQIRDFGKTKEEIRISRTERDQQSKERNAAVDAVTPKEEPKKEEKALDMVLTVIKMLALIAFFPPRSKSAEGTSLIEDSLV